MKISDFIPALNWIKNYRKSWFRGDLSAGLTVGVMLIPQGMAYAMIAGLPPIYGLYAATIPLIIYAFFGTSRQLAVGPVAMVSLLTATGVSALAETGSESFIALAISLAFLVGILQFTLGVFRMGFLVNFLSHPVISGFTSAAALIIGFSQLKHLLGIDIPRTHHIHEIVWQALEKSADINPATLAIGIGGIALILILRRINRAIPAPLLAVFFGILLVSLLGLDETYGVKIVGNIPKGLPQFSMPVPEMSQIRVLIPMALTIALVGFMESIAVAKALQAKHKDYKIDANQELIGLGLANIGSSFFSSYPVAGGFGRSAVNDQAGAKTGLAAIISSLVVMLTLLFFTPYFYHLPKAILASIIMVAVSGLIDIKEARHLWRSDRRDFYMLLATFLATLSLGIEQGIGIGVLLSLAMVIYRSTRPHLAILGRIPGTPFYRNIDRFADLEVREDVLILRFDAQLYFANVNFFRNKISELTEGREEQLKAVIISADSMNNIDSSGIHALEEVAHELRQKGIRLFLVGVKGPVRDALERSGFTQKLGKDHFFMRIQDAIHYLDQIPPLRPVAEGYYLQTSNG